MMKRWGNGQYAKKQIIYFKQEDYGTSNFPAEVWQL